MEENYENNTHDQDAEAAPDTTEYVDLDAPIIASLYMGEVKVSAEFPPEIDPIFQRALKRLMTSSHRIRGQRFEDRTVEEAVIFFDATCRRVWPLRVNGGPLTPSTPHWKGFVPIRLKTSFAAYFGNQAVDKEGEALRD